MVSDASGFARVTIQATVNAPTQPAIIKATDLTTGNEVQASFTIVQQTNGSTILSVVPATATITGPDNVTCSTGFRTDYFIYGGTAPYTVSSTFPAAVTLINPVVTAAGGFFEAITNGSCVNPLTFTIVDATGRTTTATLINSVGTVAPPTPVAPSALVITPTAQSLSSCTGSRTFTIAVSGGTPPYNVFVTPIAGGTVISPINNNIFNITVAQQGTFTVGVVDSGAPQKSATATLSCGATALALSSGGTGAVSNGFDYSGSTCVGQTSTFTVTGGTPPYTVAPIAGAAINSLSGISFSVTGLADGAPVQHNVVVTDSASGSITKTIVCHT